MCYNTAVFLLTIDRDSFTEMVVPRYFKSLVSSIFIIVIGALTNPVHAFSEQCGEISKLLKAKTNRYAQIIDTRRYNVQRSPAAQGGQENVDTLITLPSAEKCQATWTPGRDKFSYKCNWINPDKATSTANLNIIGDIIEKCIVDSKLEYARVNPKSDGNLTFITFYFAKATNLKIVLMKFGSQIKSNFEFSGNQQTKPRSQVASNGQYDANALWPVGETSAQLQAENERKAKEAQAERERQAQAKLAQQKAEQLAAQTQQLKTEQNQAEQVKLAQAAPDEVNQTASNSEQASEEPAKTLASILGTKTEASQIAEAENTGENNLANSAANIASTVISNSTTSNTLVTQDLPLEGNASLQAETQQEIAAEVIDEPPPLDPSKIRCWYFASYSSAYQEEDSDDAKSFGAVLLSKVRYVDVDLNSDLEQTMKQNLARKAEAEWTSNKPNPDFSYYNSQAFGHLSCDEDAKGRMETIHETMQLVDWVGVFDATVN